MRIRSLSVVMAVLCLVLAATMAGAASNGIGNPTLRVANGGSTLTSVIYADGITDGGAAGNGAISWDVFFVVPSGVALDSFTITPGQVWIDQCPGAFATAKTAQTSPVPGQNAYYINGFCTTTRTGPAVTGSNVPVATLTFNDVCSVTGGFNVNLHTGGDPNGDLTDMFDTNNDLYLFPDSSLTDGGSLCGPTSVELTNVQAESAPTSSVQYGALLAVAAIAAVVAGAGFAMRRRNSVNS
ncbi:MAG: hypothetical protein KDI07_05590 [Anaerolineae bacterium]|nr:hypothetical protein [Anaerolineae bacterium]MCB9132190.1 hypothetical protein [Anaerolineales bacterium]MCB0231944.1 hypothetical protein [Anaerolineae bacterium]MCB0232687.1 hypothetical protein [Anaerolineae bacterium]MCB0238480.1 hypothetical protein [Anaerolineae bacterium]